MFFSLVFIKFQVIEIFNNALNELTKKYTLNEPNEESDINLSLGHEAFQFLCKTFVGEVVKNTEANKKPPYFSTDKIKSENSKRIWTKTGRKLATDSIQNANGKHNGQANGNREAKWPGKVWPRKS